MAAFLMPKCTVCALIGSCKVVSLIEPTGRPLSGSAEKRPKYAPHATTASAVPVSPSLGPDPFFQKSVVRQFLAIRNLGLDLCLLGVEAQERWDGVDHVGDAQSSLHDVWRVVFYSAVRNTSLGLANTRLDELTEKGGDYPACWTPGGCPERQEWGSR